VEPGAIELRNGFTVEKLKVLVVTLLNEVMLTLVMATVPEFCMVTVGEAPRFHQTSKCTTERLWVYLFKGGDSRPPPSVKTGRLISVTGKLQRDGWTFTCVSQGHLVHNTYKTGICINDDMGRIERQKLIKRIERARNSRLLVYITGDRKGLESRIAVDALPFCLNHLSRMGKQKKIDLYIYSTGGVTIAGYALVNTIREFCDSFNVIIPFKALSCATLIALGADEIVMTKMGQLSPIDPSVTSPFGPQISVPGPMNVTQTVPVNVEDVISYLELAKRELNLKDEDSLVRVFDRLAQSISPLALGTINRTREQISFLAKMLLSRHMHDEKKMEQIIQTITKGRFSHDYMVGRSEAKNVLGLDIVDTPARLDKDILNLYYEYDQLLQLSTPYNPEAVLGQKDTEVETFNRAIIESDNLAYVFRTTKEVKRVTFGPPQVPTPTVGYSERVLSENWIEDKDI
jgi:hypothetical protein